jgi:hypothetical protein
VAFLHNAQDFLELPMRPIRQDDDLAVQVDFDRPRQPGRPDLLIADAGHFVLIDAQSCQVLLNRPGEHLEQLRVFGLTDGCSRATLGLHCKSLLSLGLRCWAASVLALSRPTYLLVPYYCNYNHIRT